MGEMEHLSRTRRVCGIDSFHGDPRLRAGGAQERRYLSPLIPLVFQQPEIFAARADSRCTVGPALAPVFAFGRRRFGCGFAASWGRPSVCVACLLAATNADGQRRSSATQV